MKTINPTFTFTFVRVILIIVIIQYEGGSIYNGNTLITQPTKALEFFAIYRTKDQGLTFLMVYKTLFYVSYLLRYRLLKQAPIYIHLIHFINIEKERFNKVRKECCIFSKKKRKTINGTSIVFVFYSPLSAKMMLSSDQ